MWPNVSMILEKVHFFLPKIPKLEVCLFHENHPNGDGADYENDNTFK